MELLLVNPEYVGNLRDDSVESRGHYQELADQLSGEGIFELFSPHTKILYYDKEKNLLVRAGYDPESGQIVAVESDPVAFDKLEPISQLEFMSFLSPNGNYGKGRLGLAGFLTSLPTVLSAPVLELGKTSGDSYSRRVPFRHYNLIK